MARMPSTVIWGRVNARRPLPALPVTDDGIIIVRMTQVGATTDVAAGTASVAFRTDHIDTLAHYRAGGHPLCPS